MTSHLIPPGIITMPEAFSDQLLTLSNDHLEVALSADASLSVTDRSTGACWETWPVAHQEYGQVEEGHVWLRTARGISDQYPGRFRAEATGAVAPNTGAVAFTLHGRQNRRVGRFSCEFELDGPWLVFRIGEIEDGIPSLSYPPPFKSDAIVLPRGVGEIIREPDGRMYSRHILPFFTRLNMRWIGGLQTGGDRSLEAEHAAGWIGIFDDGFEDAYGMVANRNAAPIWTRTLGQWRHGYTYRMRFLGGGYVALAKTYRSWIRERGEFITLEEKIDRSPDLESLCGGRAFWINFGFPSISRQTAEDLYLTEGQRRERGTEPLQICFTFRRMREMIDRLRGLGWERGLVKMGGWINGGYDYSHQDIWPPDPRYGPVEELAALLDCEAPLLTGLHDNNQDIYPHTPSFPGGVVRNADGTLLTGGIWAGGQTYILHSKASTGYARRNWESIRTLKPRAMFVDIITAMQLYQSYEEGNTATKADDLEAKKALMRFYKEQRVLLGSEESGDFGIPWLDWYENRHRRTGGTSIPLWPLVYHDAAFATRYGGTTGTGETGAPGWLEDMLWGYLPHFAIRPDWDGEALFTSIGHVTDWHARIGKAEMESHQILDADGTLEQTVFSTGDAIICNFGSEPARIDGTAVDAGGYVVR